VAEAAGTPELSTGVSWPRRAEGAPVAVLAHRGGTGPWRENTLDAFGAALRLGADGVELDVRVTSDGVAVVHHDAEVPGVGALSSQRAGALPPWLPTLAAALERCAGAYVNVELKLDAADATTPAAASALARATAPVLRAARDPRGVVVSSFWPQALQALAEAEPGAARALLVHPAVGAADSVPMAATLGCVALHPYVGAVGPELVERARSAGLAVTTWTVNEPADVDRVLAAGVDGIVTDAVAAALARRGG